MVHHPGSEAKKWPVSAIAEEDPSPQLPGVHYDDEDGDGGGMVMAGAPQTKSKYHSPLSDSDRGGLWL